MGSITLITGGAASGKTRWAISYFKTCDDVLFMNTAEEFSKEDRNRMDYSNKENNVEWVVKNGISDPISCIKDHKFYIFDNLCGYTMNVIHSTVQDLNSMTQEEHDVVRFTVVNSVIECMDKVLSMNGSMVIVTTEMGFGVVPKERDNCIFRKFKTA